MLGETISHYKIIEKLGEGGMGVVYRAVDTRLDRDVAIKFLSPHLSSDQEAIKRFIHEAKAASAIDHSHIGTIHEIDETEDGITFIVMGHYEGETLRQRIDRGELGVEEALDIASQIASGLSKAHQKEIVHRDIKPSNIIITSDGEVKIIDFGLAKLAGRTRLTKEASTLGTAAYMSPEQARGEEVDHRSDIFSLGVILYEMLAGEPPFKGEHEAALLYEIVHEKPASISSDRGVVFAELQSIVDKTLKKRTDERYQSMTDLMNGLAVLKKELNSQQSGELHETTAFIAQRPKTRTSRSISLIFAIVVVAVVAFILLWNFRAVAPDEDFAVAVVDFRDLGNPDNDTQSAGLAGLLHVGLVEGSPCRVISPQLLYDLRRRIFGAGRGPIEQDQSLEVARECNATLLLSGQMLISGTNPYIIWQLVDTKSGKILEAQRVEGENLAKLADQIIAVVLPLLARECGVKEPHMPPPVSALTTDSPEAYEHYMAGVLAHENKSLEVAVPELEQAVALDSTFALAYYQLSKIHFYILGGSGQQKLAHDFAEKAWKYKARLGTKDRLRLEAWREQINNRVQDALDNCREMLLRWPDDKELLKELARRYNFYWYFNEGLKVARQGLAYYPDEYEFVYRSAAFLSFLGRRREALELERSYAEQHEEEFRPWIGVAIRYLEIALPDSAEIVAHRALEIDANAIYAQGIIADCDYYRGNLQGAIEANNRILARSDLVAGQRIMFLTSIVYAPNLPILYMEGGRFEKALEIFEEARQYVSDPGDEITIELMRNRILLRLGRAEEVLRWARDVPRRTDLPSKLLNQAIIEVRALVALDSLETAQSVFAEIIASEPLFGRAHLYPQDRLRVEIALAKKDPETALAALREMKRRGMTYGAGLWYIEWRENLARAYRMAGRLEDAAEVHEKMLREFRGHFLSHYELGQIYEEMGRRTEAAAEYEIFLEMWKNADEGLPQLEDARKRLAALNGA